MDLLLTRVSNRANPFGSTPQDRAKIASDLSAFERRLRAGADHEIDTTRPLSLVAAELEQVAAVRHEDPSAGA